MSLPPPMGAVESVAPPGWEHTVLRLKHAGEISNPFALAWYMHKKGYHPHAGLAEHDVAFTARLAAALDETRVAGLPALCHAAAQGDPVAQASALEARAGPWHPEVYVLPETIGASVRATAAALDADGRTATPQALLYAEKYQGFQCGTCRYARAVNATHGHCRIVAGTIHLTEGVCIAWDADPAQLHLYRTL